MSGTLLSRLGIEHPIIQAPMAGISTAAMAAAASNAGAMGSVALGACNASQAREVLEHTRKLTSRPFIVNLFCHRPAHLDAARDEAWLKHLQPYLAEFGGSLSLPLKEIYKSFVVDREMQELLLATPPAAMSFHFGLPAPSVIQEFKDAGVFLMATATSLAEARLIEAAGIDAIVAQGIEAGGHRGVFDDHTDTEIGTLALVRIIASNTALPVIAAGGVMDGKGIAAAMLLGAEAVQMGTAFLLAIESSANEGYRKMLQSPRAENTAVTTAISGRRARGLANRIISEIGMPGAPTPPDYPVAYDAGKQLHAFASKQGSHEFAAHWAGQGATLIRDGYGTADLIRILVEEYQACS